MSKGVGNFEAPPRNKYTEPLVFVPGEYRLSQVGRVPYLVTAMPLQDLVNQIKFVEDIPEETRLDWTLEELFQRDISEKRVDDDLVKGYLKNPNKLNFFNSLTIALLPQKGLEIEENYGEPESSPEKSYPNWEKIDVGNVCIEYNPGRSIGMVRWHEERVFPVAIDGQHRLAALRKYYEEGVRLPELDTRIPLIFLILDERVGFEGRSEKLLVTLREIFIDLNKHAREVPQSRLILLEELDIQSRCVRTLLASSATETSPDVLPLPLVIWREDEVKFDAESKFSHAITSVLNLKEIVGSCLVKPFDDPSDESEVRKYVNQLNAKLELGTEVKASIEEHFQLCIGREDPFSFKDEHLTAFEQAFSEQWTPHIIRVVKEFTPYRKYFSEAKQIGAIDGMLANYLLLPAEKREKFKKGKKDEDNTFNPQSEIDDQLERLKGLKKNEWAFHVVFQKALFINLFRLEAQKESPEIREIVQNRNDFVTWWLEQINKLHENGVFYLNWKKGQGDLWRGIAKRPDSGAIQYSKAAANRINSFITISIWFNYDSTLQNVNVFANYLMEGNSRLPNIVRTAFTGRGMVKDGLKSLISDSEELDDEELEEMIKAELVKRLKAIQG